MIFATDHGSRPDGIPSRISCDITVCCRFDLVSTVGDSPVTVIVSLRLPTSSFPLTVATNAALTRMSDCVTVLNPCSSNFNTYEPGDRRSKRYPPVPSVTTDSVQEMSRSPDRVTVTPGNKAPLESVTVPVIDPVCTCAAALDAASAITMHAMARDFDRILMQPPEDVAVAWILPPAWSRRWDDSAV